MLALSDVSLSVADGEFMAIVGPSGCGKTSLLNIVAGLLRYDAGSVIIDGKTIDGPGVERAVVFQQSSLLPWRTVAGNVRYGMEMQRRFDRDTMRSRTEHFIQLVGLHGFERHYPSELSGGMQQRVNLARALAADPVVLLMDEPFAALDAQTREFMQAELLKIWSEAKKTVLFITHQINEAVYLADRVAVMSARPGRVKGIVEIPFERPRGSDAETGRPVPRDRREDLADGRRIAGADRHDQGGRVVATQLPSRSSSSAARSFYQRHERLILGGIAVLSRWRLAGALVGREDFPAVLHRTLLRGDALRR